MSFHFNAEIQADIDKTRGDAENLIRNVLPQRIATFKALMASEDFSDESVSHCVVSNLKGLQITEKAENGEVENKGNDDEILRGNAHISRLLNILKPHYLQMYKDIGILKLWMNYMIPKMEDGNNFGVDVLHSVLDRINAMEGVALNFSSFGLHISEERAKIAKKVIKHPLVEDYKNLLEEFDGANLIKIQRCCHNLYRNYMGVYSLILKNIEKLLEPRSENGGNMYISLYN